jgi:hypothetical protein
MYIHTATYPYKYRSICRDKVGKATCGSQCWAEELGQHTSTEVPYSSMILISFAVTYLGEFGCISRIEIQKS